MFTKVVVLEYLEADIMYKMSMEVSEGLNVKRLTFLVMVEKLDLQMKTKNILMRKDWLKVASNVGKKVI